MSKLRVTKLRVTINLREQDDRMGRAGEFIAGAMLRYGVVVGWSFSNRNGVEIVENSGEYSDEVLRQKVLAKLDTLVDEIPRAARPARTTRV